MPKSDFNLTITREDLDRLAPALLETLRDFVGYGLCRQGNTWERKILAEKFARLAHKALKDFPTLKLNHVGVTTTVVEPTPLWAAYAGSATGSEITLHRTRRAALEAVCSALGLEDAADEDEPHPPLPLSEVDDDELEEKISDYCDGRADDWEVCAVEVPL